jgi:hypothetical protein
VAGAGCRNASAVTSYFAPTHVTGITRDTARRRAVARRARPPVRPAGSPLPTGTISAACFPFVAPFSAAAPSHASCSREQSR